MKRIITETVGPFSSLNECNDAMSRLSPMAGDVRIVRAAKPWTWNVAFTIPEGASFWKRRA